LGVRAASPTSTFPWLNTRLPSLRFLELHTLSRVPAATIVQIIESAPLLRMVLLSACSLVDDQVVQAIGKLKNLAVLSISRAPELTIESFKAIASTSSPLAYLDIDDWPRTPDMTAFAVLADSPKLSSSLRFLRLNDCPLESEILDHISKFTNLECLQLSRCTRIQNDLQLRLCLTALPNLRSISLQSITCVTDSVIDCISQLPNLGYVNLAHSTPCSPPALARLTSARPQLALFVLRTDE
jgi:hypothetical protein